MNDDQKRQILQQMIDSANAEYYRAQIDVLVLSAERDSITDESTINSINQQIAVTETYQTRQMARVQALEKLLAAVPAPQAAE